MAGAGESADPEHILEPVARFLPDDTRGVIEPILKDGAGRNPQFVDLDPPVPWYFAA